MFDKIVQSFKIPFLKSKSFHFSLLDLFYLKYFSLTNCSDILYDPHQVLYQPCPFADGACAKPVAVINDNYYCQQHIHLQEFQLRVPPIKIETKTNDPWMISLSHSWQTIMWMPNVNVSLTVIIKWCWLVNLMATCAGLLMECKDLVAWNWQLHHFYLDLLTNLVWHLSIIFFLLLLLLLLNK